MKTSLALTAFVFLTSNCIAQGGNLSDWPKLIESKDTKGATSLCSPFLQSKDPLKAVEAHKCLANVALCENSMILLEGDDAGGGTIRGSYSSEAVDEALQHLNAALQLAPQDLSIHTGRLHLLEAAGRYSDMAKALDQSCGIYQGKEAPSAWLDYSPEFLDLRQYEAGLEFMRVLDKHYPDSADILGNIGAFLDLLKRDQEAIPYLERAVKLAPQDAINTWDLARAYDYSNQNAAADQWYQKGLALMTDPAQLKESRCLYAHFIGTKGKDPHRACVIEKKNCATSDKPSCNKP
jgi:tetratricopeptide (TPR) repeat protein